MIEKEKAEKNKNDLTAAAFTAWLMGGGEKKSFLSYLQSLGLAEKEIVTEKQKKLLIEKAHKTAQRIIKMRIKKAKK